MRYLTGFLFLCLTVCCSAQRREQERPVRHPMRGTNGAVATGSNESADAGMRMYYAGGNAVDAGVATMFAASTAEFSHFGFGGEASILIRTKEGKVVALAGVGTMPKAASADLFRKRRLRPGEVFMVERNGLEGMVPVAGVMPALVPGMVSAGLVALRDFGTKRFQDVIAPAIALADGMPMEEDDRTAIAMSRQFFQLWPTSMANYLPNGRVLPLGDLFRQPNLARTLRLMAEAEKKALAKGASRAEAIDAVHNEFYKGETARKIDAFMKEKEGLLRYEDMAAFHVKPEEPLSTTYKDYTVYKSGFWSQGPVMLQILNLLEGVDLAAMGVNSTSYIHTVTEAMKLAFADRDTYYGDPAFAHVPAARLLSKEYAAERRKLITDQVSMEFRPGTAGDLPLQHPSHTPTAQIPRDGAIVTGDTTCVNAVDKDGVMFSATPSGASLPAVVAGDTGVALSHRAQSFYLVPGSPNELAGGKRPRVTLSPTIVVKNGQPFSVFSTPGGDNQDQALLQMFLDVVEFGMNAQQAVEAPRFETRHLVSSFDNHSMGPGELVVDERVAAATYSQLESRGHKVERNNRWTGGAAPVMIRVLPSGVIEAGADPYSYRNARAW